MKDFIASNYALYRQWFEVSLDLIWKLPPSLRIRADPMAEISKFEDISHAKAIKALTAGIKDTVSMTDRYSDHDLDSADKFFLAHGLPSLTSLRILFSKKMSKIISAGEIKTDEEYFMIKSLEDADIPENAIAQVRSLIGSYELKRK